jgi:hypothetical protein
MGWELRHGVHWYLYRNHRVNGQPVKEYLGAADRFGFGKVLAHDLDRLQRRQAKVRKLKRKARTTYRARIDELLATTAEANADLRVVVEGILSALGFHKHHRGEWRMRRELKDIQSLIEKLKQSQANPGPLVNYTAPTNDAEAVELFAKARSGDNAAQDQVHGLIRARGWVDWYGDIGQQATRQLIWKAAGGDAVWEAGITEKVKALRVELLGEKPTVLEKLLVRRVINGWIATHVLELQLTLRQPTDARDRAHLDAALTRAQKRMTEAVRELARVRRLQTPKILAQLNVAAAQTVVNTAGPANTSTTQPSLQPDPQAAPAVAAGCALQTQPKG